MSKSFYAFFPSLLSRPRHHQGRRSDSPYHKEVKHRQKSLLGRGGTSFFARQSLSPNDSLWRAAGPRYAVHQIVINVNESGVDEQGSPNLSHRISAFLCKRNRISLIGNFCLFIVLRPPQDLKRTSIGAFGEGGGRPSDTMKAEC